MSTYDTPETAVHSGRDGVVAERAGVRDIGAQIFLWLAWSLAFGFWALTMSTFFGILSALGSGAPGGIEGGVDAGGAGFFLIDVVGGMIVLGAALAYGMARWATRDKRLDPVTEASTAALYDAIERGGGEDMTSRSPDARRPQERDAYRPA
ncbi:MAG: hypothetical protein JWP49_1373 [Phenylobacterium sp.]|jgi:hypothetical protein|nr:hypothetical protein [Phenylobacterium sp.]